MSDKVFSDYDFLVFGDVHYDKATLHAGKEGMVSEYEKSFFAQMPSLIDWSISKSDKKTQFAIQLGDLVSGCAGSVELQERMLKEGWDFFRGHFNMPVHPIIGNHESYGAFAYPAYKKTMQCYAAPELGLEDSIGTNYSFMKGPDLFIALDSNINTSDFVEKTLAEHPEARYVFALFHIPPIPMVRSGLTRGLGTSRGDVEKTRRLLASRNAIALCADTHQLGMAEYICAEGSLNIIVAVSVVEAGVMKYRELATSIEEYPNPASWNQRIGGVCVCDDEAVVKPHLVRYWRAIGTGVFKLRVSDSGVVADLYAHGYDSPVKSFTLRGKECPALPIGIHLPDEFIPGVNGISLDIPESIVKDRNLHFDTVLPPGWKLLSMDCEKGMLSVEVPENNSFRRTREYIRVAFLRDDRSIAANGAEFFNMQNPLRIPALCEDERMDYIGAFVTGHNGNPSRYLLKLGYDEKHLRFRFKAFEPDFKPQTETSAETWWFGYSFEIHFDLLNLKSEFQSEDTHQLALIPMESGEWKVILISQNHNGDFYRENTELQIAVKHSFSAETGLLEIDISVPWKKVAPVSASFDPEKGSLIGMECTWKGIALLGGEAAHYNPSTWAELRLG